MNNRLIKFLMISLGSKLLTELISKNSIKSKNSLPEFKGIVEVKHNIKGRLRLYIPKLKEDARYREMLINQLSKVPTIEYVEVNNITGSLILKYNFNELEPTLLIGVVIKLLGLENEINQKPKPLLVKEIKNAKESLNLALYNKTNGIVDLKSVIAVGCIILGARSIRKSPLQLPNGYTLVRWGTQMI